MKNKGMKKAFACLMCVLCLCQTWLPGLNGQRLAAMAQEAGQEEPAQPTDTPTAVPTEAPSAVPTDTPSTVPADTPAPTEAPSAVPTDAPAPTDTPSAVPTDTPTTVPSAVPSAVPTDTPTAQPTDTPTAQPADTPTAEPSATPVYTEEPSPTPPWDETLCDHANVNCVNAPVCQTPGCAHIGLSKNGLEYPLCDTGRWLLDQQDALTRSGKAAGPMVLRRSAGRKVLSLETEDITLYRSGTYYITGKKADAKLTVMPDRIVTLVFQGAEFGSLILSQNVQAQLESQESNVIGLLKMEKDAKAVFGSGAFEIAAADQHGEAAAYVKGGSVQAAALNEKSGRAMYAFPGASSVTVAGEAYNALPCRDGKIYLWLPAAQSGFDWVGVARDDTLSVTQEPQLPPDGEEKVTLNWDGSHQLVLDRSAQYTLEGAVPSDATLKAAAENITLILKNAAGSGLNGFVDADHNLVVKLEGNSTLEGSGPLFNAGAGASVTLAGKGTLSIGNAKLAADGVNVSLLEGSLHYTGTAPVISGVQWQEFAVSGGGVSAAASVLLDGQACPLVWKDEHTVALPLPASGMQYDIALGADGALRAASQPVKSGHYWYLREMSGDTELGGSLVIDGEGKPATKNNDRLILNADSDITFKNVIVDGLSILITSGARVRLTFEGVCRFQVSGGVITVENGMVEAIRADQGLSLTGAAPLPDDVLPALEGNIQLNPIQGSPLVILFQDEQGNPVANRALTLRVKGRKDRSITTFSDGTAVLWGLSAIDQKELAATDGSAVYTAVIVSGGSTVAQPGGEIDQLAAVDKRDGVTITYQSDWAKTVGVQYVLGDRKLPDAFQAGAARETGADGTIRIAGLMPGQTITYRLYASRQEGAVLTQDTQDGFQFSPRHTLTLRGDYVPPVGVEDVAYTGAAYQPPFDIPEGIAVSYDTQDGQPPVNAGSYQMTLIVPEGHGKYLPGTYALPFRIAPAKGVAEIVSGLGKSYDGQPMADPQIKANSSGQAVFLYYEGRKAEGAPIGRPVNVGTYTVVVTVAADQNATEAVLTQTFEITRGENPLEVVAGDITYGEKAAPQVISNLGGDVAFTYEGINGTRYKASNKAPTQAGEYQLTCRAAATENVKEGLYQTTFRIQKRVVYITPEANLFKYEGEEDPPFTFTYTGLLDSDYLDGDIFREEGEEAGNYAFLLDGLDAGPNYLIRLVKDAPEFTIMPAGFVDDGTGGGGYRPYDKIIPIHQTLFLSDGRRLDVVLNTTDTLTMSYFRYGSLVYVPGTNQVRPFSPSLRLNADENVLLHIQAEADLNKDGGYLTDADGRLAYAPRALELTYSQVTRMIRQGVSHISFRLKDMQVTAALSDLMNDQVKALSKNPEGLKFRFTIEPGPELGQEEAAIKAARPVTDIYRVSVQAVDGRTEHDIAPLLTTLGVTMAMESSARLMESMGLYDEAAFPTQYDLFTLNGAAAALTPMNSLFVTPYMPEEGEMPFTRLMGTNRYLYSPASSLGLFMACRAEEK